MAGIKELRLRIKSVGSIKQITRAMEMVATTKLRRFQDRAVASRPYAEEISGLVGRLAGVLGDDVGDRPLFKEGAGDATLAIVVSSDRGLCGAYNSNLFRALEAWVSEREGQDLRFFVYGRKAAQYLRKRGYNVESYIEDPPLEAIDYRNAAIVARMLVDAFLGGEYKSVWMLTTRFESMVRFDPSWTQFLPVSAESLAGEEEGEGGAGSSDVILHPDPGTIFDDLVPRYLETRIYNTLLEALTSEYASRRFAMKNATDAATDMQKVLKGIYNRKRQETITKELLDIVGGSEAVK